MNILNLLIQYSPVFLQLILATLLGSLLGVERSLANKVAGMRTYALVSLGAALFVIVGQGVLADLPNGVTFDPLRVAAQVVTGIGFLGAGLIFFNQEKLQGLTTAAGVWVAAGIGMAVGFDQIAVAVFTTVVTLLVFTSFWYIEQIIGKFFKFKDDDDV